MKQSSRLLINESPLQVLPSLAVATGLNEAIFLQQLQYWLVGSKHIHDGRKWVYNSATEWTKQFPFWSEATIKRVVTSLRDQGLVITRNDLNKAAFDRTLWYSIDYEALDEIVLSSHEIVLSSYQVDTTTVASCDDGEDQLDTTNTNRLPETTQETTTCVATATPTPQQEMFGAVCEAIGWDYNTLGKDDKGQVAQAVGILRKANYTVEDIRRFMVDIWFKDWRWEKHQQHPTLKQLRQEIGKTRSMVAAAAPPPSTKGLDSWKRLAANIGVTT